MKQISEPDVEQLYAVMSCCRDIYLSTRECYAHPTLNNFEKLISIKQYHLQSLIEIASLSNEKEILIKYINDDVDNLIENYDKYTKNPVTATLNKIENEKIELICTKYIPILSKALDSPDDIIKEGALSLLVHYVAYLTEIDIEIENKLVKIIFEKKASHATFIAFRVIGQLSVKRKAFNEKLIDVALHFLTHPEMNFICVFYMAVRSQIQNHCEQNLLAHFVSMLENCKKHFISHNILVYIINTSVYMPQLFTKDLVKVLYNQFLETEDDSIKAFIIKTFRNLLTSDLLETEVFIKLFETFEDGSEIGIADLVIILASGHELKKITFTPKTVTILEHYLAVNEYQSSVCYAFTLVSADSNLSLSEEAIDKLVEIINDNRASRENRYNPVLVIINTLNSFKILSEKSENIMRSLLTDEDPNISPYIPEMIEINESNKLVLIQSMQNL